MRFNVQLTVGICALLGGGALGNQAEAQPIRVAIGDGFGHVQSLCQTNAAGTACVGEEQRFASGEAITLTTRQLKSAWDHWNWFTEYRILWIFDEASRVGDGIPTSSIGPVTIIASEPETITSELRIIIAPAPLPGSAFSQSDFNLDPRDPILVRGAVNFRLLTVSQELLPNTRLTLAVTGDVGQSGQPDEIRVGQVYRFQANGITINSVYSGGNIYANITARNQDSYPFATGQFASFNAIPYLSAGNLLAGVVNAQGVDPGGGEPVLPGSIDFIQVGALRPEAVGIRNDILAERGAIRDIYTQGSIGTPTQPVRIRAGKGIDIVGGGPAIPAPPPQVNNRVQPVPGQIFADIKADLLPAPAAGVELSQHGRITQIRAAGNFTGTLEGYMLRAPTDFFGDPSGNTWGVFVEGEMQSPVVINGAVRTATIRARTFNQPISIAGYLKGAIIATDGEIPSLTIGTDTSFLWYGFRGSVCPPPWLDVGIPCAEPPSVISAAYLGNFYATRMLRSDKVYRPRIECPQIDNLRVGNFEDGVIWSGVEDPGELDGPNREDQLAYADVGTMEFGVVNPDNAFPNASQFYAEAYVDDFTRLDVLTSCYGAIHVPMIRGTDVIRIGCELGLPGLIDVRDDLAHHGYVIMHANLNFDGTTECTHPTFPDFTGCQDFDTPWQGKMWIGNQPNPFPPPPLIPREYSGDQPVGGDRHAPCYAELEVGMGGGAAGILPVHLHVETTAIETYDGDTSPGVLLQSEFTHVDGELATQPAGVLLRFYDPVRTPNFYTTPLIVEFLPTVGGPIDFSTRCAIVLPRFQSTLLNHTIRVVGYSASNPTQMLPAGNWRIRTRSTAPFVLCGGIDGPFGPPDAAPRIADFEYNFVIRRDCNLNGIDDADETGQDPCNAGGGACPADFDDGSFTGTPDDAITIDDLLYYLFIFDQGVVAADLDDGNGSGEPDGGVTIDDLLFFLFHFDAGC